MSLWLSTWLINVPLCHSPDVSRPLLHAVMQPEGFPHLTYIRFGHHFVNMETHNNQLANKRQTVGKASADGVQRSIKRMRGSSGATRDVATTSQKMRGKRGGGASRQRGCCVLKAGGAWILARVRTWWRW
jgi:hypothetical protein